MMTLSEWQAVCADGMSRSSEDWLDGVAPETWQGWDMSPEEHDARGIPRSPEPGEDLCLPPEAGVFCDRQAGHSGDHSTKY